MLRSGCRRGQRLSPPGPLCFGASSFLLCQELSAASRGMPGKLTSLKSLFFFSHTVRYLKEMFGFSNSTMRRLWVDSSAILFSPSLTPPPPPWSHDDGGGRWRIVPSLNDFQSRKEVTDLSLQASFSSERNSFSRISPSRFSLIFLWVHCVACLS